MTARSSSIKHAVLQFAGYLDSGSSSKGPSLQVDFNRHNISNVAILTSGGGIRQLYVDGTERSMSNMVMADIDNNAFETYTLSAFLRDSSMKDISSHAVLLQSSLSWTTTTYFTPYKHDCGTSHLANEGDMLPFVSYLHGPCGTFTTRPGLKLRVFIIYSNYLDYQLLLTDTVKNWTVGLNSTDSVFTTSTNTVQFLKAWRKRCSGCSVYIYAVVMAVEDELPPYKPCLQLENVLISGSNTAVYGQYEGYTNGIRTDRRHPDYPDVGQVGVDIKDSVTVGNYRLMYVRLYSVSHVPLVNELLPSFAISIKNTTLDSNDYGINIYNYRGSKEQLTIDGCKISSTRNTLFEYHVRDDNPKNVNIWFQNNEITDNKGNILDISGGTLEMTVSGNVIMGNGYSSGSVIRYSGYEKIIHFVNNDISRNNYNNIIYMNMDKTTYDNNAPTVVLAGNIMINNTYSSDTNRRQPARPPSSAALVINGYGDYPVQNNTLYNPGLQAELYIVIRSTKWKAAFDARFNFWGCDNTTCVRRRVYDAHNDMYLPEVRTLPFVSSSNEMVYIPDVTEGIPQGNVLGGWLNHSIILTAKDSPYYLKEDWTILHDVEVVIEAGVWVMPSRDKGILVLGKLIAKGDKEKKIVFGCRYLSAACNQWQGIVFASDRLISEIIHADFYHAGYKSGYYGSTIQTVKSSIVVIKSRIFGSAFNGIELVMPKGENIIKNNDFIDNGGVGVNVITVQTRSQALDTSVQYESVGWPGVLYGLDNICDTNTKTLRIDTDSILYFSNRDNFFNRYNCTKVIISTRGITALQILQFSIRFNYLLEIFEGNSPLTSKRILHVDQNDHPIPYDIPINSTSVTVRLVNSYRDWKYYGTQSIVFGVKVGEELPIPKETLTRREIQGNVFSNNGLGGVNITTVGEKNIDFAITKNIFRSNGQSTSFRAEHWKAAIRLNIAGSCSVTIANSYLVGNHGGILARTHSRSNNINIWSNQIVRTTQQESILVVVVEDGPHTQQCSIDGNVIQHGQGDRYSNVIHLEGVSGTVTNNYVYNNTGLHVMWWTTPANRNTSEVTTDNVIYYNIARDANNMAAIVAGGTSSFLHSNYFNNPTFKFEMTSEGASTAVNASSNYWGPPGHAQRIRDNDTGFPFPHVIKQPILDSKADFLNGPKVTPAYFPRQLPELLNDTFLPDTRDCSRFYEFTARGTIPRVCPRGLVWNPEVKACDVQGCLPVKQLGLCPLGWLQNDSLCYLYVGGVQSFSDAVGSCKKEYSALFSPQGEKEIDFVAAVLKSRAIGRQSYGIWTGNKDWPSGKCSLFNITAVDGSGGTYLEECSHLAPFICKRTAGSKCLNGCSYNGRCGYNRLCMCNRGWEGKDCSVYHCRDRNKCGQYGTCVGPNQCRCQPGWQGRACSVSYCPVYSTCRSCTEQPGCGWCDHKQRCLPGHESQPWRGQCGTWFYHDCFSVDTYMGCSRQIEYIGCEYRQCNSTIRYANDELCHRCRDVEACFSDDMSYGCRYWDMGKCPHGLVRPDYHHGNRASDTTLHSHVVAINPSKAELYVCPLPSKPGQAIIVSRDRIMYPRHRNFSIVSRQAGGIMHNVHSTKETGTYKYFATATAKLEDIIRYANFNQTVPVHYLMDDRTIDHVPEAEVLQNALVQQGKAVNGSTVREIEATQRVYKCLGHWYDVDQRLIASQYIILLKNVVVGVQVGDVIVGTVSHGFLEDVEDIVEEAGAKIYHGQLKTCGNAMSLVSIKTPPADISQTMYCHGGEHNDKSLHIAQPVTEQAGTPDKGDVIPGRASGSFLGRVISLFEKGDYILLECIPVHDISDSGIYTNAPYTAFHPGKRLITTLSTGSVFTTVKRRATLQAPSKYKHQVELEMAISVAARLELHLQSTLPKARKMGVRLDTKFEYTLNGSYEAFSGPNDIKVHRPVLGSTPLGVHCLDLSPDLCLPVNINIAEIKYGFIAETQGTGVLWRHSKGSIMEKLGGSWRNGAEVVHFPRDAVTNVSNTVQNNDGIENVNIKVDIETKLKVTIPSISDIITSSLYRPRDILDFLSEILDTGAIPENTIAFGYEPTVVITDILSIDTCSKTCFGRGGDHLLVHRAGTGDSRGVLKLRFGTSWKISSGREEGRLPGITAHCKPASTSTMCPTDSNSCSCTDGSNSTMFKGVCQCELCPDGIFKRVITGDILQPTCPCFCADNKAREMNSDGSCPCDCQCPNGNSGFIKQDGSCNCPCQCKNCQFALQKYDGTCECPNDICPVCDSAYEPVWEDCRCVCREKTQCGLYPACVRGRRGEQCDQPDCEPCSLQTDSGLLECFGNGVCTPDSHFCRSRCVCTRFWTGRCCNVRVGRTMGGDPHLSTLDGVEYDYHGIGEFWYCISPANDFGVQVRFFGYKLASLVGAIAVKVGQSVVTITTPDQATAMSLPIIRIDGSQQSLELNNTRLELSNGTAIVDIVDVRNISAGAVMMITFQYSSGASITVGVHFSSTMGRLFLNIDLTPTASFLGDTSGLCGLMDDNEGNDLTMANGTLAEDAVQFADSWRVNVSSLSSGGWSWNRSNFHVDDVMDPSYTDPSLYSPSYSIANVSQSEIEVAKMACNSKGLEGVLLQQCVFDIAVTKDEAFANLERYQTGCPGHCNGKGRCVNGSCECNDKWSGPDCSVGFCGACANGVCDSGFCACNVGWEGSTCEEKAVCLDVNNCTDEEHGVCDKTNKCRCAAGYIGVDCSIAATCSNVSDCSGHGVCVDYDVCKCDNGWAGPNCTVFSCESLAACSGHGQCVGYDLCRCDSGWQGNGCALPDCSSNNDCSLHGVCTSPGMCTCYDGYHGDNCSEVINCTVLNGCNGHGICVFIEGNENHTMCKCYDGYSGATCATVSCSSVNNCSGNGVCLEPNLCDCEQGFSGSDCSNFSCEALSYCSDNGQCVSFDTCQCLTGWLGARCDQPVCANVSDCSGHGTCVSANQCECFDEYEGDNCSVHIGPNIHSPSFAHEWYNASILENTVQGSAIIFQNNITNVSAIDADAGRNGELSYSMYGSNGAGFFSVDNQGHILIITTLDFENLAQKEFIMTVVATDKGGPPKSASAKVSITVLDVNDNAPEFQLLIFPDILLDVSGALGRIIGTFVAADVDSGSNGRVHYSLTGDKNPNDTFAVDQDTGQLTVMRYPAQSRYEVFIVAEDGGEPPRSAILPVVITVYRHVAETPSGALTSTSTSSLPGFSETDQETMSTNMDGIYNLSAAFYGSTKTLSEEHGGMTTTKPAVTTPANGTVGRATFKAWYQTMGFQAGVGVVGALLVLGLLVFMIQRCLWHQKRKVRVNAVKYVGETQECTPSVSSLRSHWEVQELDKKHRLPPNAKPDGNTTYLSRIPGYDSAVKDHTEDVNICSPPPVQHQFSFSFRPSQPRKVLPPLKGRNIQPIGQEFELPEKK
ncbi:uncharacterized protein LOC106153054 [Lingula anatina]|uniref:Uncharacterized protein LOC106153054 n=1 Tax=Lingula anatina TaxID=7574 RepID=A0A2R2MSJ2_LINAN|nr:uncharacterized protein LOC106153054 [Lingula anatina]|eukprot:XP_023933231.1 uncharacterized protein LOC106153054 [Lingula anatina]